ncbi:Na+/H+ antiporter subunit E, partial [Pseudomonas aeruginosa]
MISRSLPRQLLRVLPHPVLSVLLLLVWLLPLDSFAIGLWLLGTILGVCIRQWTHRLLLG